MENLLLLIAAILSGSCALLSVSDRASRIKKLLPILWGFNAACVITAFALMVIHLISSDFEYQYVYSHSSLDTSIIYKISALWSGQEGSFLLWASILVIMGFLLTKYMRSSRSFGIYSAVCLCICLMCYLTDPFKKTGTVFADGIGLSEALKDPWMVLHPPLVFLSYSAMAILFSCSADKKKAEYADRVLTWQRISWFFLGAGILSGSIWAYRALGWGGYWAWDPIENAAFIPWLILCAYLHRREARGLDACLLPFASACFGVFLARSGILKDLSSHAYTGGNKVVSLLLLVFLAATLLLLFIKRNKKAGILMKKTGLKETLNRLVFYLTLGYSGLIFFGTFCPLFFHYTMPIAFYNIISLIFIILYSLLLLVYDHKLLRRKCLWMLITATFLTAGITLTAGSSKLWAILVVWICLFPLALWLVGGFHPASFRYALSHAGVIVLMLGAVASSALGRQAFIITGAYDTSYQAEGFEISALELNEKGMIIKTMPLADILIKGNEKVLSSGNIIIPYETKPFILLFWSGSFLVIFQPLISQLINQGRKRKVLIHLPLNNNGPQSTGQSE